MAIKVKGNLKLEENGKSIKVMVETDEGKEYEFMAKTEHVLDEKIFESLLNTWDKLIKEKEAQAELKEEDVEGILKKRANMKSEDK